MILAILLTSGDQLFYYEFRLVVGVGFDEP